MSRNTSRMPTRPTLLAVFVLSLLVGTSGVVSLGTHGPAFQHSGETIREALEAARALALETGRLHGVVFEVGGDRAAVVDQDGSLVSNPLTPSGYALDGTDADPHQRVTIEAADFGTTRHAAIFDADGVPLAGGSVVLRHGDTVAELHVDAATGYVALR